MCKHRHTGKSRSPGQTSWDEPFVVLCQLSGTRCLRQWSALTHCLSLNLGLRRTASLRLLINTHDWLAASASEAKALALYTHQVRLHLVDDSSQGSSSSLSSVTSRAAIGLDDQLLVHEEVNLPSSPSLQVVFQWIDWWCIHFFLCQTVPTIDCSLK